MPWPCPKLYSLGRFTSQNKLSGYVLYWSERRNGCKRSLGKAFALKISIIPKREEFPCSVTDIKDNGIVKQHVCYLTECLCSNHTFFWRWKTTILSLAKGKFARCCVLFILGDLNNRVGNVYQILDVIEKKNMDSGSTRVIVSYYWKCIGSLNCTLGTAWL